MLPACSSAVQSGEILGAPARLPGRSSTSIRIAPPDIGTVGFTYTLITSPQTSKKSSTLGGRRGSFDRLTRVGGIV